MSNDIPNTIVTKELSKYVRVSPRKWKQLQKLGQAPLPKYRGGEGYVYLGIDIKRFLGVIDNEPDEPQDDLFLQGLKKLGRTKK